MKNNGKIKRLIVGTPQGDAGELTKESRFAFNYTTAERARETSLLMPSHKTPRSEKRDLTPYSSP